MTDGFLEEISSSLGGQQKDLFLDTDMVKEVNLTSKASNSTEAIGNFLNPVEKSTIVSKQLDWVFTHRKVEYLEATLNLSCHKSVAIRRKIAGNLPKIGTFSDQLITKLQEWQKSESDRETWLLLDSTIDKINRSQHGDSLEKTSNILSVSEAIKRIKLMVSEKNYIIEGEIIEPKNFYNMFYFGLKDGQDVRMECRVLSFHIDRLNFPLNEGLSIRVTGKFTITKQSRMVFEVVKIELTGEGELLRNLQLLDQKLENEGLFDQSRKRQLNSTPKNILLIASPNSAALKDFCKVLFARRGGVTVFLLPIKTQGTGAELEILDKLGQVNDICNQNMIDTIVMTRGGGSKDDLFIFNSEKIVRSIHGLNRPTVVAIGHEQDHTLAEKVADQRASTPSNAAELVSLTNSEIISEYNQITTSTLTGYQARLANCQIFKDTQLQSIKQNLEAQTTDIRTQIQTINRPMMSIITEIRQTIQYSLSSIEQQINSLLSENKNSTSSYLERIQDQSLLYLNQVKVDSDKISTQIESVSPKKVLSLGYALVCQKGLHIESKTTFDPKVGLQIEFQDGQVMVDVK